MFPRHLGYEVAIVTVICTVSIFLFPAARGPYSAIYGPATALFSLRAGLTLRLLMALDAIQGVERVFLKTWEGLRASQNALATKFVPSEQIAVLRC